MIKAPGRVPQSGLLLQQKVRSVLSSQVEVKCCDKAGSQCIGLSFMQVHIY